MDARRVAPTLVELLRGRAAEGTAGHGYTFLADGGDEERLSFAGLDERARGIAALLQEHCRPGDRALLLYAPGIDFIAAFFGCLYAGVVAVPAYPPQSSRTFPRLLAMARDARPKVALTTSTLLRRLEAARSEAPELGALPCLTTEALPAGVAAAWREPGIGGESLAFLQYTSGSTALPKGVMVSHANLLHNEEMIRRAFGMNADSVVVGWLPLYHDMGLIGNVLQPLYADASCVLMSPTAFLQQPFRWLEAISRYRGTTSGGPNFAYELCARKVRPEQREQLDLSSWTVAYNGAEPVRAETLERFARTFAPCGFRREAFFPCYGLAEATLFVTGVTPDQAPTVERVDASALERGEAVSATDRTGRALVGSGRAWMEQTVLVVDPESARPCPEGRVGEIWVSGLSVAGGYWRQPEVTEKEFRARTEDGAGPFLRTGDLGFLRGSELFVTGRLKDLIILRGRNLYPQDVELTAERSHPALRPGCSAAFAVDAEGEERLVVVQEVDRRFQGNPGELVTAIRRAVTEEHDARVHAVALIEAGTIPKTSSGKIQRRACRAMFLKAELERIAGSQELPEALEAPAAADTAEAESEALTFLREQVAALSGLPLASVDAAEPVTALGLDSLGAVELSHRVEARFGVLPPLASLLEGPSLTEVAGWIGSAPEEDAAVSRIATAGDEEGDQPLSYGQRALWFLQRLDPGSAAYNISAALNVHGRLDVETLEEAADLVTRRHSSLRSSFHRGADGPVRRVHRRRGPAVLKADAAAWSEGTLRERLHEEAWRPFDLEQDPLLRLAVFRRGPEEHVLLITVHHIVSDLWSLAVLKRDLDVAYRALRGDAVQIPAPPRLRWADSVRWQGERLAGPTGERLWEAWRERLAGELPETTLLPDRPRATVERIDAGPGGASLTARLDAADTDRLRRLARGGGTTLSTVLLTGFLALLHRATGQDDLLVGVPTDGRDRPELADLVGYLVNPVVVRADASGDPPFAAFLAAVRGSALFSFEHREMPFPFLVERLQPERDASRPQLFQTLFVFQRSPRDAAVDLGPFALGTAGAVTDLAGLRAESVEIESRAVRFDLELVTAEVGQEIGISLRWDDRLYERATMQRLLGHLRCLLAGAGADPSRTLSALPIWNEADLRQILADLNNSGPATDDGATVHGLFQEQARRTPDAVAVAAGAESVTYRELADRAAGLARCLMKMGVAPEEPVAVCLDRRVHLVEALLGVMAAGGAYVPVDPAYPRERQSWLLEDSGARVLLTRTGLAGLTGLGRDSLQTVLVDARTDPGETRPRVEPPPSLPAGLAYLIYTSGSTGRPKGVAIEHRSAVAFLRWALDVFPPESLARTIAATSVCFDLSVFELFAPLVSGGTVVLVDDALAVPTAAGHAPTLLNTVPSSLAELLRQGALPPSVRTVNLAGEPLRRPLVEEAYRTGTVEKVFNLYGPSEDTTYSTWALVPRGADRPVTIGRPMTGTQAYVLDARMRPVPFAAPGELYLGGAGLARGYFDRPELTAVRFVPDPFAGQPGGRLYRTGDRARLRADGDIELLGRLDQQVKVRGFRIEPGEIESVLASSPAVREALVTTFEPRPGDLRLVAYAAPTEGSGATVESLRSSIRERLPEFMVPASWVLLPALPRTPNGKVDRKALPAPDLGAGDAAGTIAPRGEVEELLAGLWSAILGVERVGADASFFALGGHSLSAAQVVSRVRNALGVEIPLRAFFAEPTVAGLARRVERALQGGATAAPSLTTIPSEPAISYAQQRLWILNRLDPEAPTYNMPGLVRLHGPLDRAALETALNEVARRQESLRTIFREEDGAPVAVIATEPELTLALDDLSGLPAEEQELRLQRMAEAEARRPFDLDRGPLVRATLVHLGDLGGPARPPRVETLSSTPLPLRGGSTAPREGELPRRGEGIQPRVSTLGGGAADHALLLTLHHAIADGWSQAVLAREVSVLYTAALHGEASPLAPLPVTYSQFARWQRTWLESGEMDRQLAFWRERLDGDLAPLELPLDRPRPAVLSSRGGRVPFALDAEQARDLRNLARREGNTLFMALLAGLQALLHRLTGQTDITIGTVVANRNHQEVEEVIGLFVNSLVLRGRVDGDSDFRGLLSRARETTLEAWTHQDLPFERLVDEIQPERDQSRPPLVQVLLTLQNQPTPRLDLAGTTAEIAEVHSGTSKFELSLSLTESEMGIAGWVEHATDLFEPATVERLLGHWRTLLVEAAADPGRPVADLPLLSTAELRQILVDWNDFRVLPTGTLAELVEAQAGRTPGAVALVAGDESLTYRELLDRSRRLAHHLRALGVGPEVPAAVRLERKAELVVSLLAVLEAGGAYVPVDPKYPVERQAYLLEDSGAPVLISRDQDELPFTGTRVRLDSDAEAVAARPATAVEPWAGPRNLAYLIYTSGSTGRPKGVAIEHRSAVAFVHWAREVFPPAVLARTVAATSVCFDLSVFELFVPLASGGAVVLVEDALAVPAVAGHEPTLVNTVPSALAELLGQGALPPSVRTVNLAGEPLRRSLVEEAYRTGTVERVFNLYGPSEDTTYSTWTLVPQGAELPVTIGRPLAGTQAYVLDARMRPVPAGTLGELYLGGAGLARGYFGRPELTAERFVPDPFTAEPGGRLYRTGDRARRRTDGEIDFLGRIDQQVKIRGFRIEPGEVEAVLTSSAAVREALVTPFEPRPGDLRLVAYAVPAEDSGVTVESLRSFLRERLPEFMVPASWVLLPALPRTPNGKVDRKALPAPDLDTGNAAGTVAPRGEVEELLAGLWAEVLGAERVGADASFFTLGGHSLSAAQVVSRVRGALGVEIPLRAFFEEPTVAGLARRVERSLQGETADAPVWAAVPSEPAVSYAQQRLWILNRLDPEAPTYNMPGLVRLRGPLDRAALEAALHEVARRQESLRTTFQEEDGAPVAVIAAEPEVALALDDLSGLPAEEQELRLQRMAEEEARRPFDLGRGPLVRATLIRLGGSPRPPRVETLGGGDHDHHHALLLTLHHAIADGWSQAVLAREVSVLYTAALHGEASPLAPLPITYSQFARWQRTWLENGEMDRQLAFWRERPDGDLAPLEMPLDHPRPAVLSSHGGRLPFALDAEPSRALRSIARREGTTLFMTLLAGLQALLHRLTGQADVAIGTAVANRNHREVEEVIGLFVNTLVLRGSVGGDSDFRGLLSRARETTLEAWAHQDLPFERLVDEIQPERDQSRPPLFQVLLTLQNQPAPRLDLAGTTAEIIELSSGTSKFELSLSLTESEAGIAGWVEHATDLFEKATVERLLGHWRTLLAEAAVDPGRPIADLPLLSPAELQQVLVDWNDFRVSPTGTLAELIEAQADRTPGAVALVAGDESLTYRELLDRSRRLAHHLRALVVGPEVPVAVRLERKTELVVSLLAVLQAGGAYVPVDPKYPVERQAYLLEDSGAPVLISRDQDGLPFAGTRVRLDVDAEAIAARPATGVEPSAGPGNLAYLIYTSGSTGRPKGVAIEHRSAVAFVHWAREVFPPEALARTVAATSVCFDLSVFELFVPLSSGGTVVLVDDALAVPAAAGQEPTLLNTVPSALAELLRQGALPPSVRTVNLAGEPLRRSLVEEAYHTGTVERVFNLYGPSEDTTYSTWTLVPQGAELPVMIGRPVAGTQAYVLDARMRPVPAGTLGELSLGGAGLARGYFGRPELTAERFVPDPFAVEPGGRLYRTGDRARRRTDGEIDFLGRIDQQVKIRGFRIEPGEVEAVLMSSPAVREALVTTFEPLPGDLWLVAYVVTAETTMESLRGFLRDRLPEFMVPASWVLLPALPRTPNGKVDRRALPAPDLGAVDAAGTVAPRGEVEELLAGLWAEVLKIERIGSDAHFFTLGGHSLSAAQVVSRVRGALGVEIPLRAFFEEPTVAGLARRVERALQGGTADAPVWAAVPSEPAISYAQQRLWILNRLDPEAPTYNMPGLVRLRGPLDRAALEIALNEVARRQESLRTTFREEDGAPVAVIAAEPELTLALDDLSGLPAEEQELRLAQMAEAEARRPFDLGRGPLVRATLVRIGEDDHALLLILHHAIADGWSQAVLAREVSVLYTATLHGEASPLPPLPMAYSQFARWQRTWLEGGEMDRQLAFWRERLGGDLPLLELPLDHPRPPVLSSRGGRLPFALDAEPAGALRNVARREGATLFMTLLAGLQALLHRLTGQTDVTIGTPVANRNHREVEEIIGLFVNTLVLRGDLNGDPAFRDLLAQARETTLEAWAHQDLPFERLVDEIQTERDQSRPPLFQVLLALQHQPAPRLDLAGTAAAISEVHSGTSKFELSLSLAESEAGIAGWVEHATDLFERATVERLLGHWRTLLVEAVADPGRPITDLPLLGAAERHQILVEWNDLQTAAAPAATLGELVAAQAARTPGAVALVAGDAGDHRLIYRELMDRSHRLAHHLRALGVGPEVPVAVLLERRAELVVSLLAILQAGGAYVPIDPKYPVERQAYLLDDSRASVLVCRGGEDLAFAGTRVRLDADAEVIAAWPGTASAPSAGPRNVAYLIYTSGSTGRPKGVAIEHRSAVALVQWAQTAFSPAELAGVVASTSVCFDLSVFELFVPLSGGGTVILVEDALALLEGPAPAGITLINTVPSAAAELVRQGAIPASVRTVSLAGEPLRRSLVDQIHALPTVERVWNLYGPSEDTTYSTGEPVPRGGEEPTIGRPVAGTDLRILDPGFQPLPIGAAGEVFLTGAGLARSYHHRPDLTAERFLPDPLAAEPGGRLYRTGDLGRFRPDGRVEYLGRADHQVKVRGFRIELGEVEAVLAAHPAVLECAAAAPETAPGERRLTGYVVWKGEPAGLPALIAHLRARLPQAMVPAQLVEMEALPHTPNGKVDRKRLPLPAGGPELTGEPVAPRNAVESQLADLWREVLQVGRLGVHDDFFALGGHSLLAARLMARANAAFAVELPLRSLFERPTVAGLASRIETARRGDGAPQLPPLRPVPRDGDLPLSFAQERMWVMDRLLPGSPVYNVFQALRLSGPLDRERLADAFAAVARRHEVLRTVFPPVAGTPVQQILPDWTPELPVTDLTDLPPAEQEEKARRMATGEARTPFDLATGPLLRLRLLVLDAEDHVLLLTLHHIVCDDWSVGVLVREVEEIYRAGLAGRSPRLPELPVQYADFAVWQRGWLTGEALDAKLAYWKAHLGSHPPVLTLPTDRPRPAVQTFHGAVRRVRMPGALAAELRAVARAEGATLFMALLAGYAAMLSRAAGQPEVVVGCASANRDRVETEGLIGFFVNILPVRIDLAGASTWRELLRHVRTAALGAYDHPDLPFERLVAAVQPRRDLGHAALRQVGFAFENHVGAPLDLAGVTSRPLDVDTGVARLDLTLFLWDEAENGDLAGGCEYNTDLFDAATVDRFLERFESALTLMAGGADHPLPELAARVALPVAHVPESNFTSSQLLFWFAHALNPDVQLYFDLATTTYEVEGELEAEPFRQAFQRLVDHCDALRSTIRVQGGVPMRVVQDRVAAPVELVDLSAEADPRAAYAAWLAERCRVRLALGERLFDCALVRLAPDRTVWFWNVHHIIADAWSLARIADVLSSDYELARAGRLDEAEPLPSYQLYVDYERELRGSRRWEWAREYWERKLSAPWTRNQFYRRDPTLRTTRAERHTVDLGEDGSAAVRRLTAEHELFSPAVVFATVLFALVHRLSGERTLRIGTPFANRSDEFASVVGLQMNACPLQVEMDDGETFLSLARKIQQETVGTAKWQFYPVRNPVESPVYDVYLNYQNVAFREFCGLPVTFDLINSGHTNDLLDLQVRDFGGRGIFHVDLDLNAAAFDAAQGRRTQGHFLRLLEAFAADGHQPVSGIEILAPEERRLVVEDFNATAVPYPKDLLLHELIEAQVERTPDAEAVAFEGERITYRELDRRANRLAWRLRGLGVGPDVRVGVYAERSVEMVVALLAILKAGGAYVPLDPGYPAERIGFMVQDARVPVILTQSRLADRVPASGATVLCLDGDLGTDTDDRAPRIALAASSLAYVIFTSGSTGRPKGAMLAHAGICNRLLWMQDAYRLGPGDRVLQKTPFSFDVSVWEFFWPLLTGAALVVARPGGHQDPAYLSVLIDAERITTLHFVPSMLQILLAREDIGSCASLKRVILSGEALPEDLRRHFYERLPAVDLHNLYGPTEASVDVTSWACPRENALGTVPIGRPIANTRICLLDRAASPVPCGLPGELAIGGVSLARGYLDRPDLTAERFVPDPFAAEPGARLYRTGDLARHLPGGDIEYLGRIDHQVKLRGFRIELGEIEAAVARHPGVREAVALVREDRPGDRRLVAYMVGTGASGTAPGVAELRTYLKDSLPEHMVPAAVVRLDALPLTPSGKVDRHALPAPDQSAVQTTGEFVAPRTPLESLLASIWAEVLGLDRVSVHDSFFDLGGTSLAATRATTLVQEVLPVELLLRHVFEAPTVARIAAHLEEVIRRLGDEEQRAMSEVLAEFELLMEEEKDLVAP
jgi:amino acid adenylation domain-containing protein